MAKKFVKTKDNATVYYRQGNTLRPITSTQDFAALNGGNTDIAGNTDVVDSLPTYNSIGGVLGSDEIGNISKGLVYNPLSNEDRQGFLSDAQAYYKPSRDAFGNLIKGKVDANNLQFDDTKSRLKTTMDNTITGVGQDLSNRGFLRSGEQVTKSVQAGDQFTKDVNSADIQRAIAQANLLLEEANYNSDIDKSVQAAADARANSEITSRGNSTAYAQSAEKQRLDAIDAQRERDYQLKLHQIDLQKANSGSSSFKDPGYSLKKNALDADGNGGGLGFFDNKGVPISAAKYLAGYSRDGQASLSDIRTILSRSEDSGDKVIIQAIDSGMPLSELQKRWPYVFNT